MVAALTPQSRRLFRLREGERDWRDVVPLSSHQLDGKAIAASARFCLAMREPLRLGCRHSTLRQTSPKPILGSVQ